MKSPDRNHWRGRLGNGLAITMARPKWKEARDVRLWAFEPYLVETMIATRENPIYLPSARVPNRACQQLDEGCAGRSRHRDYRCTVARLQVCHFADAAAARRRDVFRQRVERHRKWNVDADVGSRRRCSEAVLRPPGRRDLRTNIRTRSCAGEPTALVVASPDEEAAAVSSTRVIWAAISALYQSGSRSAWKSAPP